MEKLSRDLKKLGIEVKKLHRIPAKKFDNAVCDIIDIGGYSLAVLLYKMHLLPIKRQIKVARKIEDFLFFHPTNGHKLISRIKKSLNKVDEACTPYLLSALVDISEQAEIETDALKDLGNKANEILLSDIDLPRKGKAISIIVKAEKMESIPTILNTMRNVLSGLDEYPNYSFIETSLLALKKLGGETLLRLLINPDSSEAMQQMRIEWRTKEENHLNSTISVIEQLDENFAQIMLKVIDLSEFNLPFIAMIREGLNHTNKWVRQAAATAMKKVGEVVSFETVSRMLNDPASEVRLMAVSSLGGLDKSKTGEILEKLASKNGESLEIRMNALYALYSQKNLEALTTLSKIDNIRIAVSAHGLSALLMPHQDGLEKLLDVFAYLKEEFSNDMAYYILELAEPEDLKTFLKFHSKCENTMHRERHLNLIRAFINKKSGPRLEKAIKELASGEQKAVKMLIEAAKATA